MITASVYTDRRGVDDAEAGFVDNQDGGIPDKAFAGFEQRYYNYHRERHGYGIDLGYAPSEANSYFLRYYDARYSETVNRNILAWNLNGAPTVDPINANGFLDTASFSKSLRDEKEYLDSKVAEIGGKNLIGDNTLDYHVGYTKGTYYKPYDYNARFDNPASVNVAYDNATLPNWPTVAVLPGTTSNGTVSLDPTDPGGYTLARLRNQVTHSDDHEWGVGANMAVPTHFTSRDNEELKFGVNARIRRRTSDSTSYSAGGFPALALADAVYGDDVNFYHNHYQNGPQISDAALRAAYAASSVDPPNVVDTALNKVFDKEDVYAVYGQYQFGYGALGITAGARIETTKATYAGNKADASGDPASAGCPLAIDSDGNSVRLCPESRDKTYTNFFPSVQARYEFTPDLIGRFAISSTIARPGFQQVTAATVVGGNGDITTGNPNLKPTTATGVDIAIEKYLPAAGIASVGVFAKQIKDYIVTDARQVAGGQQNTGGNLGIVKLISFANASTAHLYGVELNYVNRFKDRLPGALAGLGVAANWTWVQSKYQIRTGEDSVLPSTSRNTANAALLYEMHGADLSLGAYYTGRNIFGVGGSAALDVWTQERLSIDFGSQFKVSDPLAIYFNVKNLTNTPLKFTEGPGANRVIQREFYSTTFQAGMTYKF